MPRTHLRTDAEPAPHLSEESVIARSPLFDQDWYLRRNPDVAVSCMDPALHYLAHGAAEGRDPGPQFSTAAYLAANPDVERHGMNPLLHYVLHGKAEGRQIVPSIVIQTNPSVAKREYEHRANSEFEAFLDSNDRISIVASDRVRISIIVVLHNKAHFSYGCLRSIEKAAHARNDVEAVIVDSGSTDRTGELLSRVDGAVKTVLSENAGFVRSVNRVAGSCSGDYIVLLNNDAVLKPGSLDYALQTIQEDEAIAAVGGRITLPSGLLQEAGCILWSDGTAAGYGRGHLPTAPPFMFRRDVSFCSGAFLMIRQKAFIEMGGFDERFAPAYYEETDLCVRLRQAGYRVVYDPRVELLHYEFGSAESPDAALKLQARQRGVFVQKHREFLATCPAHESTHILNARSVDGVKKKILFLDDHVPYPELGVGYPRALNLLRTLAQGHFITMIPLEYFEDTWESVRRVVPLEIEVMLGTAASVLNLFLSSRVGYYDLVFVSRPNNLRTYLSALSALETTQRDKMRAVPIIYDAEAIWALRENLQRAVNNAPMRTDEYEQIVAEEVGLA